MTAWFYHVNRSFDLTVKYLEKCLRIKEGNFPSGHVDITEILMILSQVRRDQNQYDIALVYELKCFLMYEKIFPPCHIKIGEKFV